MATYHMRMMTAASTRPPSTSTAVANDEFPPSDSSKVEFQYLDGSEEWGSAGGDCSVVDFSRASVSIDGTELRVEHRSWVLNDVPEDGLFCDVDAIKSTANATPCTTFVTILATRDS